MTKWLVNLALCIALLGTSGCEDDPDDINQRPESMMDAGSR